MDPEWLGQFKLFVFSAVYFCLFMGRRIVACAKMKWMHMFVPMCGCSTLCVHRLSTWSRRGASRVASGPPSACTSSPFEALKQGRLGMINGPAEWHAPQLCFRPPASSPAALPPDTASSVTAPFVRPHTRHVLSVTYPTYPQCHLPPSPPKKH